MHVRFLGVTLALLCVQFVCGRSPAQPVTIPEPLMRCGLGTLLSDAYSPDGKYIATGGGIGAMLWNVEAGSQGCRLGFMESSKGKRGK